ncbi:hypothetical protein KEM54_001390 [Ascosphaera aggregata]|nr:hypothetical protein KEM54_001390 [Ascosphaera aggregata]
MRYGPASELASAWPFLAFAARGCGRGRRRASCTPVYLQMKPGAHRYRIHETWKRHQNHQAQIRYQYRRFSACASLPAELQDKRNLYRILGVSTSATKEEIKKKFYALSLAHHPDKNRFKPNSSSEYSSISAAYNTLSNDVARAKYDAEHNINPPKSSRTGNQRSHVGSRPASGLSKRRTPFHGSASSFYAHRNRSGKTGRAAPNPNAAGKEKSKSQPTDPDAAWFVDNDHDGDDGQTPHFDAKSHYQTQRKQDERRRKRRIASLEENLKQRPDVADSDVGGTETMRFCMLTAVIGFAAAATLLFKKKAAKKERKESSA